MTSHQFTDANQNKWSLTLNLDNVRRIRSAVGVDFGNMADGTQLLDLAEDCERLMQTLWILCEEQADARGVSPEEFGRAFDGPTRDAAEEAILAAIVNFTRASRRDAVRAIMQQSRQAEREGMQAVIAWASGNRLVETVRRKTTEALESGDPSPR